jgi:hypothetical protein
MGFPIRNSYAHNLRIDSKELAGFRKRLYDRWKVPLESLRMLLCVFRGM